MASRLKEKYIAEIAPALNAKFGYKSVMQIPKLSKVIVNVGCGESKNNAKEIEAICKDIATITGQKPVTCKARKSVANFKLREGETVGVKVTLRGDKMYEQLVKSCTSVSRATRREAPLTLPIGGRLRASWNGRLILTRITTISSPSRGTVQHSTLTT